MSTALHLQALLKDRNSIGLPGVPLLVRLKQLMENQVHGST